MEGPTLITPVSNNELPPEFKKFDKTLGMPEHVFNIVHELVTHAWAVYYLFYLLPFGYVPVSSLIPGVIYGVGSGFGLTVGAHRYWTHRTFKAKLPLQILLMLMQTATMQYPIFKWCRDHRVHHKCTDTDADPHSAACGFWFSHITWLFHSKHPDYLEKIQIVEIADLARDPVVRFQSKYYWELVLLTCFIIPMAFCRMVFPEMSWIHIFAWNMNRYIIVLHVTFLVNSVAHVWGDGTSHTTSTFLQLKINWFLSLQVIGEGWHNYHHTFPWDYKAAELGYKFNLSTMFIHFFAWIGWAYDLKTVSHKLLVDRINRTGDGSHSLLHRQKVNDDQADNLSDGETISRACWGWGDGQLRKEDMEVTEILFPIKNHRG